MMAPPLSAPTRRRSIITAADIDAMNSTTQHFLGTRQPSWINAAAVNHSSDVNVGPPVHQINRSVPVNYPVDRGDIQSVIPSLTLATPQLSVNTTSHVRIDPPGTFLSLQRTPTLLSPVLPSPAPSEEGLDFFSKSRQAQTAASSGRGIEHNARRLLGSSEGSQHVFSGANPPKKPRLNAGIPIGNGEFAPPAQGPHNEQVQTTNSVGGPYATLLTPMACSKSIESFVSTRGGIQPLQKDNVIVGRLNLLSQACLAPQDLLFLVLHQILCLFRTRPADLPPNVLALKCLPNATRLLGSLLGEIRSTETGFVEYFAEFPLPVKLAVQVSFQYSGAINHAVDALTLISQNFEHFEALCIKTQHPPLIWEMVQFLGVHSPLLERIICNAIVRRTFHMALANDPRICEVERAYREYQKEYGQLVATTAGMDPEPAMHFLSRHGIHNKYAQQIEKIYNLLRSQAIPVLYSRQPYPTPSSVAQSPVVPPASVIRPQPVAGLGPDIIRQQSSIITAAHSVAGQAPGLPTNRLQHMQGNLYTILPDGRPAFIGYQAPRSALPNTQPGQPMQPRPVPTQMMHSKPLHTQFFARPGVVGPQITPPEPFRYALHQVKLRSPILRTLEPSGQPTSNSVESPELFQYIGDFATPIEKLNHERKVQEWCFKISTIDISKIPVESKPTGGEPPIRILSDNSQTYRLRCVKTKDETINDIHDWVNADTSWPHNVYFNCNGIRLQARRKLFHGKDLAIDITTFLKPGENTIRAMSNQPKECSVEGYLVAVEVIRSKYRTTIKSESTSRKMPIVDTIEAIKKSLTPPKTVLSTATSTTAITNPTTGNPNPGEEDELTITNNTLTIPLCDPFLGTSIWTTPARATTCRHRDCFDLDIFLNTRMRKCAGAPSDVDVWACPICSRDARPDVLMVDGWMEAVREKVIEGGGVAKVVVVSEDGSWVLKEGPPAGVEKKGGKKERGKNESGVKKEIVIVDLDLD